MSSFLQYRQVEVASARLIWYEVKMAKKRRVGLAKETVLLQRVIFLMFFIIISIIVIYNSNFD